MARGSLANDGELAGSENTGSEREMRRTRCLRFWQRGAKEWPAARRKSDGSDAPVGFRGRADEHEEGGGLAMPKTKTTPVEKPWWRH